MPKGKKEPFGQPGRHQGGRKGSVGQPARQQGGTREKTHLIYALPTKEPAELKLLPLFVHTCEEFNNQITASIFWKKNAPRKDRHRFRKKTNLRWRNLVSVICLYH